MSVVCPEGHTSQSTDYCDVCGAPIAAAPAAPAPVAVAASAPTPTTCPHCDTPAAQGALFCENCGYDFTTGATPDPAAPATGAVPRVLTAPSEPGGPAAPASATGSAPAVPEGPLGSPGPEAPAGAPEAPSAAPAAGPAGAEPDASAPGAPAVGSALPTPGVPGPDAWVAEMWVDPDWYAVQQPEDPLPSVGLPVLVPLRSRSLLVGRPSASRNIHPQIDCGADAGVSRRHCQLSTDGLRWWVEDLQSSNGTYVARAGEPLPDVPLPPGQRHELQDGDRVFVGAWTRIVVRQALPGEV
ncbi:FHA domain-containing protein [Cellulomonas sp. DKR-3]|uniref:FHA domain-containing protein n=1 Tax=Cellulomonas fulva TaxID=2835530 RepID=A0ABS5U0Q4_9CELL|nr:FHA domain-containing protein [Cellulomonas fulva]MBT0994974.1 FHA domain-containing protein [Cellulomonas fulva]